MNNVRVLLIVAPTLLFGGICHAQNSESPSLSTREALDLTPSALAVKIFGSVRPEIAYVSRPKGAAVNSELHRLVLISNAIPADYPGFCRVTYFDIKFGNAVKEASLGVDVQKRVSLVQKQVRYKFRAGNLQNASHNCKDVSSVASFFKIDGNVALRDLKHIFDTAFVKLKMPKSYCLVKQVPGMSCSNYDSVDISIENLSEVRQESCAGNRGCANLSLTFSPGGFDEGKNVTVSVRNFVIQSDGRLAVSKTTSVQLVSSDISID